MGYKKGKMGLYVEGKELKPTIIDVKKATDEAKRIRNTPKRKGSFF